MSPETPGSPASRGTSRDGGVVATPVVTRLTPPRHPAPYAAYTQGTLALELRGTAPALPETPDLDPSRRCRAPHPAEDEVRTWAARLAQAVVEVTAGRRPASQLVRWVAPTIHRDLDRRARLVARVARSRPKAEPAVRPQVRSVHVCFPTPTVAEVSVHVRYGARSRSLALRLERREDRDGRWLCTALELG